MTHFPSPQVGFQSQTFSNVGQPGHGIPSSPELDLDLLSMCKCAAAELHVQWLQWREV